MIFDQELEKISKEIEGLYSSLQGYHKEKEESEALQATLTSWEQSFENKHQSFHQLHHKKLEPVEKWCSDSVTKIRTLYLATTDYLETRFWQTLIRYVSSSSMDRSDFVHGELVSKALNLETLAHRSGKIAELTKTTAGNIKNLENRYKELEFFECNLAAAKSLQGRLGKNPRDAWKSPGLKALTEIFRRIYVQTRAKEYLTRSETFRQLFLDTQKLFHESAAVASRQKKTVASGAPLGSDITDALEKSAKSAQDELDHFLFETPKNAPLRFTRI